MVLKRNPSRFYYFETDIHIFVHDTHEHERTISRARGVHGRGGVRKKRTYVAAAAAAASRRESPLLILSRFQALVQ